MRPPSQAFQLRVSVTASASAIRRMSTGVPNRRQAGVGGVGGAIVRSTDGPGAETTWVVAMFDVLRPMPLYRGGRVRGPPPSSRRFSCGNCTTPRAPRDFASGGWGLAGARLDRLDGVIEGLFQHALADGPEHQAECPSFEVLPLAHHHGIDVGLPVGPPCECVNVAR